MLNAALTEAKELGSDGDPELLVPAETSGALGVRTTPPAKDIGSNCMNEPVRHNQQPLCNQKPAGTEGFQTSSEESTTLPGAPAGIAFCCQPDCFPQNPSGPSSGLVSRGSRAVPWPGSPLPSIHTPPTAPARPSERSGLRRPGESLFKEAGVDPFQRGTAAGGMCSCP